MKPLPDKWARFLVENPETGMGYQIATVKLNSGECFEKVVLSQGFIYKVYGFEDEVPFEPAEISNIEITHDKWKFD